MGLLGSGDKEDTIDAVLHLWYSAFITQDHYDFLQMTIRAVLDRFHGHGVAKIEADGWVCKKVVFGESTLSMQLRDRYWPDLASYLDTANTLQYGEAHSLRQRRLLAEFPPEQREDRRDFKTLLQTNQHRLCWQQLQKDGILLPFGHSRAKFDIPNPLLFVSKDWHLRGQQDPFHGWDIPEVFSIDEGPTGDSYGKLHRHVKSMLRRFLNRVSTLKCDFLVMTMKSSEIASKNWPQSFDRMEVSFIKSRSLAF